MGKQQLAIRRVKDRERKKKRGKDRTPDGAGWNIFDRKLDLGDISFTARWMMVG